MDKSTLEHGKHGNSQEMMLVDKWISLPWSMREKKHEDSEGENNSQVTISLLLSQALFNRFLQRNSLNSFS